VHLKRVVAELLDGRHARQTPGVECAVGQQRHDIGDHARPGAPRGTRLHDTLIELCRGSGFQPASRPGGWESAWELDALAELGLVALGPESLSRGAPADVVALPLVDTDERLETAIVSRAGETSPLVEAFAEASRQSGVTGPDDPSGPAGRGACRTAVPAELPGVPRRREDGLVRRRRGVTA
jgi:hypothetical protein